MAPVVASRMKLVAPSTRSRSGRSVKPSVVRPSISPGDAVVVPWSSAGCSRWRRPPRGEGAADRLAKLTAGDARHIALVDEVADGHLVPSHVDELPLMRTPSSRQANAGAGNDSTSAAATTMATARSIAAAPSRHGLRRQGVDRQRPSARIAALDPSAA